MLGFKGRIARKRPTTRIEPGEAALPSALRLPQEPIAPPPPARTQDERNAETARAGVSHVPRPESSQHAPARRTMESARPETTPKIWDLEPPSPPTPAEPASMLARCAGPSQDEGGDDFLAPGQPPMTFRAERQASAPGAAVPDRARTRLLGFHGDGAPDVFADQPTAAPSAAPCFPIGWLIVTDGPGRGACFTLTAGLSSVGRDADQTVSLDFGDDAISRAGHLSIAHDEEDGRSWVGHGGKANIVRLNERPLLSTEELHGGDILRIGKTVLRYVALCDDSFSWAKGDG
ncbi:FHA domain-containing protein [Salipiger sp. 1_MG-2023]|uniref:FHA domain-containing protein n=1 Tax=Salipiger sp. 1_MG-2023 TaxID=3062665 RepID=UPI0026E45510|nr:FHA domain-containing protein [Salipiger sp. 1_MG-2023]MDO6588392.1 FHA domain-containing protein [Salipiger sp. 1_MG-2023]